MSRLRTTADAALHRLHWGTAHQARVGNLAAAFADLLPPGAQRVLDVGSGDGYLASRIMALRPELSIRGVDVLPRRERVIDVELFDGVTLPVDDRSFDVVMFSDVLHHAGDPSHLLAEARRVAARHVAIKDHLCRSPADALLLRAMDWFGNRHNDVPSTHDYWPARRWRLELARAGLGIDVFDDRVVVYPPWLNALIGRHLHVLVLATPV